MLQEADYLLIDRYLDGLMSPDEMINFEIRVQENEEWRDALERQQEKQLLHRKAFERRMERKPKEPDRRNERIMRQLMISIAIGACIVASLLFLSPWKKNIYLQFASVEMVLPYPSTDLQLRGAAAFNKRHFDEALPLLNEQLRAQPTDTFSMLYKGIALMELDSLTAARQLFAPIFHSKHSLQYDAAFYTALTYEREHDPGQALNWLAKIPEGAPNYNKAQQMANELR